MKRPLAVSGLAAVLLLGFAVPAAPAHSAPGHSTRTAADTVRAPLQPRSCSYQVSSAQFIALQDDTIYWQGCIITLNNDIDLTGVTFTRPIGTNAIPFTSTFDGNVKTISNLTVNVSGSGTVYAGLFGVLGAGGEIKNLSLTNATILGSATSGTVYAGVVARSFGQVRNIQFRGTVHGTATGASTDTLAGGLVAWGSDDTVIDSNVAGTVTAEGADQLHAGGIVGQAQGRVIRSLSLASVQAIGTTSALTQAFAGGIAAQADDTARILDSYAQGLVSAQEPSADDTAYVGGIVGWSTAVVLSQIDRTYYSSVASQTGYTAANVGGIAGYLADGPDVSRAFYLSSNPLGVGYSAFDAADDTALSADEMKLYASYAGTWPIVDGWASPGVNVWGICDGQGYPYLLRQVSASPCITGLAVTGAATIGSTLEGTATASRALAYQWGHVAGASFTPIAGQDDTTYVVQPSDAGTSLALRATYDDSWVVNVSTSAPLFIPDVTPPTVYPPGAPTDVTAVARDASATIAWRAPADAGSYPVTTYQATASPGGASCLTSALTCTMSGLTNGTPYTFTVRALNGAGWGPDSARSNAITPRADPSKSILIIGSRGTVNGKPGVIVEGTTTDLVGTTVTPWLRFPGQTEYRPGSSSPTVAADGTFTWQRQTGKKVYIYFTAADVRSNRIVIRPL